MTPQLVHCAQLIHRPIFNRLHSSSIKVFHRCNSSNTPLEFPCLDKLSARQLALEQGPEPIYDKIVSGYSVYTHSQPLKLYHAGSLPGYQIAFETWGDLNEAKDNAILVHTGLSGSSHAKSNTANTNHGWWESFIGPGKSLDTNKFHIICSNVLGSCYGSTGPSSLDPSDGLPYATRFPIITIWDMVHAQFHMLDWMGINKLHASVGASMGGMQSLAAAALYPDRVNRLVSISAATRSHPYSIALRYAQRQVLMADPNWNKGFYYKLVPPHVGMKLARQIATVTYRSGPEWEERFGRTRQDPDAPPSFCADYLIETYLDHQGERFCLTYDPNSLLYISKAMDMFNISDINSARERLCEGKPALTNKKYVDGCNITEPIDSPVDMEKEMHDIVGALKNVKMPALILGAQSDILFPVWQQKEIADCLTSAGNTSVSYYELAAKYGHDTFLIDLVNVGGAIKVKSI